MLSFWRGVPRGFVPLLGFGWKLLGEAGSPRFKYGALEEEDELELLDGKLLGEAGSPRFKYGALEEEDELELLDGDCWEAVLRKSWASCCCRSWACNFCESVRACWDGGGLEGGGLKGGGW